MSSYARTLQSHLAAYKVSRLGVKESGTYVYRKKELRYKHILPRELRWLNIIEPVRSEIRQYVECHQDLKLHKYFHHLNSSQAFALNLFFPFFEQGNAAALLHALGDTRTIVAWQPEHIADVKEGTNVDVMWQAPGGAMTFCEVKLSENEFGIAKNDAHHGKKLQRIYEPVLAGQCAPELLQPTTFFANYQLLRNVWLVARNKKDSLVFLMPRANVGLWSRLNPLLTRLTPSLASRIRIVAIEDVFTSLSSSTVLPARLAWYVDLLREKYIV